MTWQWTWSQAKALRRCWSYERSCVATQKQKQHAARLAQTHIVDLDVNSIEFWAMTGLSVA